jgi:DNA-binding NtrC family response regulator
MSRAEAIQPEDIPADFLATQALLPEQAASLSFLATRDYREAKRQFEIAYIKAKLREHDGNITRTAAAIGLHRQSLQEKLRELGIQAEKE